MLGFIPFCPNFTWFFVQFFLFRLLTCLRSSSMQLWSQADNSLAIVPRLLLGRSRNRISIPGSPNKLLSLFHRVHSGAGVPQTSYAMDTGGSFVGGEAAEA
jgi:hypothetical protein